MGGAGCEDANGGGPSLEALSRGVRRASYLHPDRASEYSGAPPPSSASPLPSRVFSRHFEKNGYDAPGQVKAQELSGLSLQPV
jgi:hypothetical protein